MFLIHGYYNDEIYFADFETTTYNSEQFKQDGHTSVWLWCVLRNKDKQIRRGNTIESFIDFIFQDGKNKTIYFHNLSFDGNFIVKWFWRHYPEMYSDFLNVKKDDYIYCFENDGRIYEIDIRWKNVDIRILCSYNLLSNGIGVLGNSLKIPKHNEEQEILLSEKYGMSFYDLGGIENYNKYEDLRYAFDSYIKRDVTIAYKAYNSFKEKMIDKNSDASPHLINWDFRDRDIRLYNTLTISALVQKLLKNYIFLNNKWSHIKTEFYIDDYSQYDLMVKFMNGGITQFNKDYQNGKINEVNGISIDINSSYPYQMTKLIPYGKLIEGRAPENTKYKKYLEYVEVEIRFSIKLKYRLIPCMRDRSFEKNAARFSEMGSGKYYFLLEEFETLQKFYEIKILSIKYYHCKADYWLKDFITKYYKLKSNARDDAEKFSAKILLNSLYGSFCKKAFYPTLVKIPEKLYDDLKQSDNPIIEVETKNGVENWKVITFTNKKLSYLNGRFVKILPSDLNEHFANTKKVQLPNMLVGATITAYARIQWMEAVLSISKHIGIENVLYGDTDSIKINSINDKWKKELRLDDKELGAWKIEKEFDIWKTTGAKRYLAVDSKTGKYQCALAGIKKQVETWYEIERILTNNEIVENARLSKVEDEYGIYLKEIDVKIKDGKN